MMRTIYRILLLTPLVVFLAVGAAYAGGGQQLNDPGQLGRYAVGHTSYLMFNPNAPGPDYRGRPVFMSVFYPVDAGAIKSSTPPAQYLTDPYAVLTYTGTGTTYDSGGFPPGTSTYSTDWQPLGYDPAYEGPKPSKDGAFPPVMFSHGWGGISLAFPSMGTRLASHGYVVAVLEHWGDGQWPWSPADDAFTVMFNRPRDVSFAITKLLAKSSTRGELLAGAIDPARIVASGWSFGGYAAYTLAGGDDSVCDALSFGTPVPGDPCFSSPPDPRIKAIISMDGTAELLQYHELARISVPSLILGETVQRSASSFGFPFENARPHAAINRDDSYRVDVNGAYHVSFSNGCDALQVLLNVGQFSDADYAAFDYGCSWAIPSADAREAVSEYMIAFLDIYLGGPNTNKTLDWQILAPEYAFSHTPTVQIFDSEGCQAVLPGNSYFSYNPFQGYIDCYVAQKDPTGWFGSSSASSNADPALRAPAAMLRTPARVGPFRPSWKHF